MSVVISSNFHLTDATAEADLPKLGVDNIYDLDIVQADAGSSIFGAELNSLSSGFLGSINDALIDANSGYVYTASGSHASGLVSWRDDFVSPPSDFLSGGSYQSDALTKQSDNIYLLTKTSGLLSVDVSDPENISIDDTYAHADFNTGGYVDSVAGYVFIACKAGNNIHIVDISDPTSLVLDNSLSLSVSAPQFCIVNGDYLYISSSTNMAVVDITDPTAPSEVATLPIAAGSLGMCVYDDYLLISDSSTDAIQIIDITDPTTPTLDNTYTSATQLNGVWRLTSSPVENRIFAAGVDEFSAYSIVAGELAFIESLGLSDARLTVFKDGETDSGYFIANTVLVEHTLDLSVSYASQITASTTETGAYPENVGDRNTFDFWRATALPAWVECDTTTATQCNYIGIANHNLFDVGASFKAQYYDGSTWQDCHTSETPADNKALMVIFSAQTATKFRLYITGAGAAPLISLVNMGMYDQLPRSIHQGHTPVNLNRKQEIKKNISELGWTLGVSHFRLGASTNISIQNVENYWVRNNVETLNNNMLERPFFFAWKPVTFPDDVGLCWLNQEIHAENNGKRNLMDLEFSVDAQIEFGGELSLS